MSRKEDFIEAAYNNDRESSKQEQQFFVEGCEYGYQYYREKVMKVLHDDLFVSDDIIILLNRIMED